MRVGSLSGIRILIKEAQRALSPPYKDAMRIGSSQESDHASTPISDSQPPEL